MQIARAASDYFGMFITKEIGAVLFIFTFATVIYLGSRVVGRVNAILFTAMVAAYFGIVWTGIPEVHADLLFHREWSSSLIAIPLLLTSFSFQTMVPSLTPILKRNIKALRYAIVGGTLLAFIIYALWQALILGIVPVEGPNGLAEALFRGEPATQFLREHVNGRWICVIAEYFAFFAIVTSFLGIALGLFDFLADGLKIPKNQMGKLLLAVLIIVPTIIFATQYERVFLVALETTGGFGDSILNGLIPVTMVWMGRYKLGLSKPEGFRLMGGKSFLVFLFVFFLCTLMLEIVMQTGTMALIYEPFEVPVHNL